VQEQLLTLPEAAVDHLPLLNILESEAKQKKERKKKKKKKMADLRVY
jgi:hypothetical protein